jgi:hypothetical protein
MVLKIFFGEALNVTVMSTLGIEPENGGTSSGLGTGDSKLNPVLDGGISGHAHSPDVTSFDVVSHVSGAVVFVNNSHSSVSGHLESFTVRSILLSFLGHKTNVRHVTHGLHIELSVFFAVVEDSLVNSSVATIGNASRGLLTGIVLVPGGTTITDDAWHTGINNDVRRDMEVSDTVVGVTHV